MVEIRPIRDEDAVSFHEVLDSVCRERRFLTACEAPPLENVRSFVASNLKQGVPLIVAAEAARIIGWCCLIPGSASLGTGHVGNLSMGVLKAYRRQGIGRRMLEAAIEGARKTSLQKIELGVFSSNRAAAALYRAFGFEEEGLKKRGRFVDGIYDDIILMALHLPRAPSTAPGNGQTAEHPLPTMRGAGSATS